MEPDFGSWQAPDISRSHLYRGTIAWTPPTVIYQEYTVLGSQQTPHFLPSQVSYVVPIVRIWEKIYHVIITAPHCACIYVQFPF